MYATSSDDVSAMRAKVLLFLATASALSQTADAGVLPGEEFILCNNTKTRSSRGAHCRHSLTVRQQHTTLVCVQNEPLSARTLLSGGLLRLFDVESARIHADRLSFDVDLITTSEDTWLAGAAGSASAEPLGG